MPRKYTVIVILDDTNVDTNYSAEEEKILLEEGDFAVDELIELAENDDDCSVTYTVEEIIDGTD